MLRFADFVDNCNMKIKSCLVFGKHDEKITDSSTFITLNSLQNLRLRGVFLELRV